MRVLDRRSRAGYPPIRNETVRLKRYDGIEGAGDRTRFRKCGPTRAMLPWRSCHEGAGRPNHRLLAHTGVSGPGLMNAHAVEHPTVTEPCRPLSPVPPAAGAGPARSSPCGSNSCAGQACPATRDLLRSASGETRLPAARASDVSTAVRRATRREWCPCPHFLLWSALILPHALGK